MKRESGYYWVKSGDSWMVGRYFDYVKDWYLPGIEESHKDSDFDKIDEHKIEKTE